MGRNNDRGKNAKIVLRNFKNNAKNRVNILRKHAKMDRSILRTNVKNNAKMKLKTKQKMLRFFLRKIDEQHAKMLQKMDGKCCEKFAKTCANN